MKVPWAIPFIDGRELEEVTDAVETNWLSMGARVRKLEELWSNHLGARHGVAVTNGTVALELALRVLDVGPGDEAIIPAMTYSATASAVVIRGAGLAFADIEKDSWNLDPGEIEKRINDRTRVIIFVDYGGNPSKSDEIRAVADRHGIPLLHDAAQSLGGSSKGRPLGFQAPLATTSFHAAKLFTSVEGGMIFTDDDEDADRLRILRNQGENPNVKYQHIEVGYNARMSDLHAAVGIRQFCKYEEIVERRARLAHRYLDALSDAPGVELLKPESPGDRNAWFFFPIFVDNRDAVAKRMGERGVDTRIAYPMPVYEQPAFAGHFDAESHTACPVAEHFARRVLNLPMFHEMTDEQQDYVVDTLVTSVSESV